MDLECENIAEVMGSMLLYSQASTGGPLINPTEWLRAGNLGTDRLVSVSHILLPQTIPLFSPWRLTSLPSQVPLSSGFHLGLVNKKPQQLIG